ncbi:helix-turn-helix transcriptional regulator [bacterium]|nr:helix-turn-helix transcriptional regulator [bacterium]
MIALAPQIVSAWEVTKDKHTAEIVCGGINLAFDATPLAEAPVMVLLRPAADLPEPTSLTAREARIVALLRHGLTDREVACRAGLSERVVRSLITGLLRKTGARRRSALAALRVGLVAAGSEHHAKAPWENFDEVVKRSGLSWRQQEVAALVLRGLSNVQIAACLHLSPITVGSNLTKIYKKTGTATRSELMALLAGTGAE